MRRVHLFMDNFRGDFLKNRKRIVGVIIFAVLVIGIGYRIYHILGYQDNVHSNAVLEQFYDLDENLVDVVWVGPSSVQEDVISSVMFDTNGIALYPLALGNMPFNATEPLIRECEKTQNPQVYLVDIRDLGYQVLSDITIRRVTDNMKFSPNRFQTINEMTNDLVKFYPDQEVNLFDYYVSFTKYHTRWTELTESDFTNDKDSYMGYWIKYGSTPCDKNSVVSLFETSEMPIPEEAEYFLMDFLDFCDSFDKEIIFTCTPNCLDAEKFGQFNYIKRIIQERGYEVWDFNYDVDEIGIDYSTDYSDPMHLNMWGARKFSEYVAQKLDERYDFEDHRQDERYEQFVECSERFNSKLAEIQLITEGNLDNYLDKLTSLQGDYTIIVSTKEGQGLYLSPEMIEKFNKLGFDSASVLYEQQNHSFIGIVDNGITVCQLIGYLDENVEYSEWLNNRQVSIKSMTLNNGNCSSIILGNDEYSKNSRGLNFVVVNNDTGLVVDSVSFDTYSPEIGCTR